MLRGLYTSTMGMKMQDKKMEVITNNLANVNTNGYKKDTALCESFNSILTKRINDLYTPMNPSGEVGTMGMSADINQVFTDYRQGQLINTENRTDLAIANSDTSFFVVDVEGESRTEERYTRDGAFTLNSEGKLVTKEGYTVKGEQGPIIVEGQEFEVNSKGEIFENGEKVGQLKIKTFKDTLGLRKIGENLLMAEGETEEEQFKGTIMQGFVEGSNVNSVKEMVEMITVVRAYEASQKAVKVQDETLGRAVNDIPRL